MIVCFQRPHKSSRHTLAWAPCAPVGASRASHRAPRETGGPSHVPLAPWLCSPRTPSRTPMSRDCEPVYAPTCRPRALTHSCLLQLRRGLRRSTTSLDSTYFCWSPAPHTNDLLPSRPTGLAPRRWGTHSLSWIWSCFTSFSTSRTYFHHFQGID